MYSIIFNNKDLIINNIKKIKRNNQEIKEIIIFIKQKTLRGICTPKNE